jgi:L-fuculose-phosphate aldolase
MTRRIKETLKRTIVEAGLKMVQQGLTVGTWGNISARDSDTGLVYISPSATDYEDVQCEDIVVLNDRLEVVDGSAKPSIEKRMHLAVYRTREDVNAVIHTHPLYSSVLGVNRMDLPGISEDFVQIVGDRIICSKYALPGTQELAENVVEGLGNRNAVLLPNHGTLCVGKDMHHAFKVCQVVEKTAHIFILARSIGTPGLISEEDIREMRRFARNVYGQG